MLICMGGKCNRPRLAWHAWMEWDARLDPISESSRLRRLGRLLFGRDSSFVGIGVGGPDAGPDHQLGGALLLAREKTPHLGKRVVVHAIDVRIGSGLPGTLVLARRDLQIEVREQVHGA